MCVFSFVLNVKIWKQLTLLWSLNWGIKTPPLKTVLQIRTRRSFHFPLLKPVLLLDPVSHTNTWGNICLGDGDCSNLTRRFSSVWSERNCRSVKISRREWIVTCINSVCRWKLPGALPDTVLDKQGRPADLQRPAAPTFTERDIDPAFLQSFTCETFYWDVGGSAAHFRLHINLNSYLMFIAVLVKVYVYSPPALAPIKHIHPSCFAPSFS